MSKPQANGASPLQATSFLQGNSAQYIEHLHARYAENPDAIDSSWREYFQKLGDSGEDIKVQARGSRSVNPSPASVAPDDLGVALGAFWEPDMPDARRIERGIREKARSGGVDISEESLRKSVTDSLRALMLIRAYRIRGHLVADLDPLKMRSQEPHPELEPATYGFGEPDMDRPIYIDNVMGLEVATLREILGMVKRTYCGTFALQYMHISDPVQSQWLKERIEGYGKEISFTQEGRTAILRKMIESEEFEKFLHVKYMGTKRFGLDGGEALIPAMEQIIKRGGALGVKEIVIGMPHRGRLNILANVMSKPYRAIFNEFKGGSFKPEEVEGSGDVKYHLGSSSDREFDGNEVHLSLTANPSHLEAVNPVVLGKARAKQEQLGDDDRKAVLPVLLHGDAAFAGQGIVAECFGLSGLVGHKTGGTIHLIVNNQIGFTTAPHHSRSSPYPTDIALMVEAPIFHVNGDDPEAVVHAARVATEFRQKFGKDAIIDMFCYRRFGHNEGDEPMFTQPRMYTEIRKHKSALDIYSERLASESLMPMSEIESMKAEFREKLDQEFEAGESYRPNKADWLDGIWSSMDQKPEDYQRGETCVAPSSVKKVAKALTSAPENFNIHKTIQRLMENRKRNLAAGESIDWATAEALAFGTLMLEGTPVRLSGQDCTRGTFSQRHSGFIDQQTERRHLALNSIEGRKARFEVIDSMLSEYAVLGFEYGYSLADPNTLVIWEAQFGDFANGAQIMFDQFISSGERKWLRMSGLVVLLPHGFEGQGPEHSSARLERFLQLSAEDNWIVANCTTPANYFHILRRQMRRTYRKPLILMTPKSLLRHKVAVSAIDDFTTGSSFHRILWDDAQKGYSDLSLAPDKKIKKVVLCSGKVYFDLLQERDRRELSDVYLMRVEQFYPAPLRSLIEELGRFKGAEMVWCQEEPKNQGAWSFMEPNLEWVLDKIGARSKRVRYAGRPAAASTATGLLSTHKVQQERLIDDALSNKEPK